MKELLDTLGYKFSRLITVEYSTSFSISLRILNKRIRNDIYPIYGFTRLLDEIVDSLSGYDQVDLFNRFVDEYRKSLEQKISLNLAINSFQRVVRKYDLYDLVENFINSMEMDLYKSNYKTDEEYRDYIHGSANVIGLMCLKVFVKGDKNQYDQLKSHAISLGSAFQKVNFLRDYANDNDDLRRSYFPNIDLDGLDEYKKKEIIRDIKLDLKNAFEGIKKLPKESRLGVLIAYKYYEVLLKKISSKSFEYIKSNRVRIPNIFKLIILTRIFILFKVNLI